MARFLLKSFIFVLLTAGVKCQSDRDEFIYGYFPDDFIWGLATSSYQIEGAWNADGKGTTIWDTFAHANNGENIADRSNGDLACDSYNRIADDVQLLKNMGADFYRFSISWSRILWTGTLEGGINAVGLRYYSNLIDALLAQGLTPYVTIYHWDLPQPLEDKGGWLNETIATDFAEFSRILFRNYGDRVKNWITFNEPGVFCGLGYGSGGHAPGIKDDPSVKPYLCGHNLIKAHGLAYRIYESEFKASQNGRVGITISSNWQEPEDPNNPSDVEAAHRAMEYSYGQFANPLYRGEYPASMRELIDQKSAAEGRPESRLPSFDAEWTRIINGTLDFFGLNHYSTNYIRNCPNSGDEDTCYSRDPDWEETGADWLRIVPWGFRRILVWISNEYGHPDIYVTESGCADLGNDSVNDEQRKSYYRRYTNEMLKAVNDGASVKGYTAWSLMDNFEWAAGYMQRFGVNYINWTDPNLTRVPKESGIYLTQLFADNGFPNPNATVT